MADRSGSDTERALRDFLEHGCRSKPEAGVIVGFVELRASEGFRPNIMLAACTPTHLVAIADLLLKRAGEKLAALDPARADLVAMIQAARVSLAFAEESQNG